MSTATATREVLTGTLEHLGRFSAEGPGVTRLAYDAHWCDAQRWLAQRAGEMGLATTVDAAGNLFFHDRGIARDRPVLLVGSHLDSVRNGGRYDGAYGVVCGLLAAAEFGARTELPVVGLVTAEEEGSRFSGDMLGARGLLGRAQPEELDAMRDAAGTTWREALRDAESRGCAAALVPGPHPWTAPVQLAAMIEMHIEQGPILEDAGLALGIVDHVIGYRRLRARVTGAARHAGTTPMRMRKDALAACAEMILAVEAAARRMGDPAVATAGFVRAEPGLYNVVPGACELWIEMRHVDAVKLGALFDGISARCAETAAAREVRLELEPVAGLEPATLSTPMVEAAAALATERGIAFRRMASGAGHDAMLFAAAGVPTLLMFVPSRDGISHSPDEHTDPDDLWAGYQFLRAYLERMTRAPESA